jgi:hypothetical protein
MRNSPAASLLVAALVMLRHPCTRNKATAQLLLERAAEQTELSPAEREACRNLADDLDREHPEPPAAHRCQRSPTSPAAHSSAERRRLLNLVPGLPFAPDMKGVPA